MNTITLSLFVLLGIFSIETKIEPIRSVDQFPITIGKNFEFYEDVTGKLNIEDIVGEPYNNLFKIEGEEVPNFGVTESIIWARFRIQNFTDSALYLLVDNPILDYVELYELYEGRVNLTKTGQKRFMESGELPDRAFIMHLDLDKSQLKTYYLKVSTITPVQLPMSIGPLSSFLLPFNKIDLFHGLYYGFILVIFLYNLFIFISVREKKYIFYISYALGMGLFHAYLNGHASLLNIGLSEFLRLRIITLSMVCLLAMNFFTMDFLSTRQNVPKLHKLIIALTFLLLIPALLELIDEISLSHLSAFVMALIIPPVLLATGVVIYRKGFKPAKFYLISWVALLLGIFIFSSATINFIPYNAYTKKAMEVGSAIEMFLISLALADRINLYRDEKEEAQNQLLEKALENETLIRNQNVMLESKVQERTTELEKEKDASEKLLLNILPAEIAEELKEKGEADARDFDLVSVLFTDFKGFTQASEKLSASELVNEINVCFKAFDEIVDNYGIEKIKTIGDSYMCAGGLPVPDEKSVKNIVLAGLDMQDFILKRKSERDAQGLPSFEMRVGINTGPVVAGIVGVKKFQYDIWGDTVNTASRMESNGEVGKINISGTTYELVKDQFTCLYRGKIQAKGKGEIDMYFVEGNIGG